MHSCRCLHGIRRQTTASQIMQILMKQHWINEDVSCSIVTATIPEELTQHLERSARGSCHCGQARMAPQLCSMLTLALQQVIIFTTVLTAAPTKVTTWHIPAEPYPSIVLAIMAYHQMAISGLKSNGHTMDMLTRIVWQMMHL